MHSSDFANVNFQFLRSLIKRIEGASFELDFVDFLLFKDERCAVSFWGERERESFCRAWSRNEKTESVRD